eukprot:4493676-Amphidinium_carterae.1
MLEGLEVQAMTQEKGEHLERSESASSPEGSGQGGGRSAISETMTTTTIKDATIPSKGEARHLPPTAVEVVSTGATVVVGSQEYLIGRKLGKGGFGVVHEARLVQHQQRTEDQEGDPSCIVAMKFAGSIRAEGYINVDLKLKLAAMAVEAAAAAEARRLTHDEVTKWEGKVFLP